MMVFSKDMLVDRKIKIEKEKSCFESRQSGPEAKELLHKSPGVDK